MKRIRDLWVRLRTPLVDLHIILPILCILLLMSPFTAQTPPPEALAPGVPLELAKWRATHYSDVRYKLNLTLEKMSPVLKGTIEIRLRVGETGRRGDGETKEETRPIGSVLPIILDWRKLKGHEEKSTISNIVVNGKLATYLRDGIAPLDEPQYHEPSEHLVILGGIEAGENVIKLDFTSPILTSGSAITRYVDKEDGSEYIYSLFVPSDASTAFPVFDQPDLKARFTISAKTPGEWEFVTNEEVRAWRGKDITYFPGPEPPYGDGLGKLSKTYQTNGFTSKETKPISTYVFAFAAGPFQQFNYQSGDTMKSVDETYFKRPTHPDAFSMNVFVRKSQAAMFHSHSVEVFRLNREAIKYFEQYFDYKFPFPKYDLVLIPEFPFGGMEHAGATFLRESSIIFPQEPTKNDHISRALLIFHEASHQWFGDTVTMRWFDDLWLKEGFATFTAYKAMERIMPEMMAWKVFYERVKQAAYQTDSTKGTTPIYQEIPNLSAAKSAYGNIVYNKAPAFLRQAEFYLGEDKFQTAVRAFLKKHEYANAGWEDFVKELEAASEEKLQLWANKWITQRGMPIYRTTVKEDKLGWTYRIDPSDVLNEGGAWSMRTKGYYIDRYYRSDDFSSPYGLFFRSLATSMIPLEDGLRHTHGKPYFRFFFPNSHDYGYGIFLLDEKSRDYVLKNIQNEKDPFLRSMMWGALWDSVREGELDPKEYVELVVKVLSPGFSRPTAGKKSPEGGTQNLAETDESTIQTLLGRVSTAMRYYLSDRDASAGGTNTKPKPARKLGRINPPLNDLQTRVEALLIDRMQNASTPGQRITYYRAFLNLASSENARRIMKVILRGNAGILPASRMPAFQTTKDKFDIVSKLIILGDPEAPKLLADLEKTETSDEAKRYAYAAKAGFATAENKAKYWNDFVNNKEISESWIEAAFGSFNSTRHADLTLPYLQRALQELPNHKSKRKIFFVNGWLGSFIGGQRSEAALAIVNKFLADNPMLDRDLRLKVLENVDVIERAVKIRKKFSHE